MTIRVTWSAKEAKDDSAHIELATGILSEARDELSRADNKAALLLAAAGVVVGSLLAALIAGDWLPSQLCLCAQWIWWTGALSGVAGLVALAYAVYPRTKYRRQRQSGIVAYFGDVVSTSPADLKGKLISTADTRDGRVLDQLIAVSSIVDRKYRGIQAGLWLFAACGVMCTLAILLSATFA